MGIVVLKPAGTEEEFARLAGQRHYSIGRHSDNDIVIIPFYTGVSRFHCDIQVSPESVRVLDKSSSYGTYVNDVQIEPRVPRELVDGDRLRFGRHFELDVVIQGNGDELDEANNTKTTVGDKLLSLFGLR
jgi:pSer/pThr/pTyr-binding forkhead associated (FHA) protein